MIRNVLRVVLTLAVVGLAALAGWRLWDLSMREPWTRDARVRAEVVSIAPDIAGQVDLVAVADNTPVKSGDLLFRIDKARFVIALARAEARVAGARASVDQAQAEFERDDGLSEVVSEKVREEARSAFIRAQAEYRGAFAALDAAKLDLERTEVRAPVNGIVSRCGRRSCDGGRRGAGARRYRYLPRGGLFSRRRSHRVAVGAPARIRLMGEPEPLAGHVESIAGGIADRERSDAAGGLANVNGSFAWVRLAQRVPVRIALDPVPVDHRLVSGLTATVVVDR